MRVPGHQQRKQDIDISDRSHAPDFKTSSSSRRIAISALVIAGTRDAAPIANGGSTNRRAPDNPVSNARSNASVISSRNVTRRSAAASLARWKRGSGNSIVVRI